MYVLYFNRLEKERRRKEEEEEAGGDEEEGWTKVKGGVAATQVLTQLKCTDCIFKEHVK